MYGMWFKFKATKNLGKDHGSSSSFSLGSKMPLHRMQKLRPTGRKQPVDSGLPYPHRRRLPLTCHDTVESNEKKTIRRQKANKKSNILRFNVIKWNGLDPSALPCLDFSADSGLFKKPKKACSHLYETAARWYQAWISDFLPATLQQLRPWITGHGAPIYALHWKNKKK